MPSRKLASIGSLEELRFSARLYVREVRADPAERVGTSFLEGVQMCLESTYIGVPTSSTCANKREMQRIHFLNDYGNINSTITFAYNWYHVIYQTIFLKVGKFLLRVFYSFREITVEKWHTFSPTLYIWLWPDLLTWLFDLRGQKLHKRCILHFRAVVRNFAFLVIRGKQVGETESAPPSSARVNPRPVGVCRATRETPTQETILTPLRSRDPRNVATSGKRRWIALCVTSLKHVIFWKSRSQGRSNWGQRSNITLFTMAPTEAKQSIINVFFSFWTVFR